MEFVNLLIDVPVTTHPGSIVQLCLDLVQPVLGTGIYGILIDHREKCLHRLIPIGTGMG